MKIYEKVATFGVSITFIAITVAPFSLASVISVRSRLAMLSAFAGDACPIKFSEDHVEAIGNGHLKADWVMDPFIVVLAKKMSDGGCQVIIVALGIFVEVNDYVKNASCYAIIFEYWIKERGYEKLAKVYCIGNAIE
eukprot:CAMPEP_0114594404 /NCGR_PEP_ID=MMETSP0125-20121206/16055_1 /TAXON_ID=485358 ORGANISM="Aristerostoma sp., Strain ATCC 50986" /NCGR_SAMPLE_ID=MMETSP0125 /ASSEMBLY_ACC=CAM_ASM_000245 /LENGTH=136 /DNA_ID=CAMNT_0001794663 /DNA_START=680 /DNA_END=1090 /DNA_ORIENTATION=+